MILSDFQDKVFTKSTQFMAIYNSDRAKFVEFNESIRKRMGESFEYPSDVKILAVSEVNEEVFLTLSGVPCKLKKLITLEDKEHDIVELFPAHTKKWNQSSDLISLTDLTSDGVWEWFPELDFEYMSMRFWDILGYHQEEQDESPQAWKDYIHPDDAKAAMETYVKHVDSKGEYPYHQRVRYTHKDGHEVFVLCRGSVVDWLPDGRPWRILGTHTDVTDIVKKDAVEAQSKFIARMSHEIRSPICTILNECELLQPKVNTSTIMETCQQLIRLTDDILSLGESQDDALKVVNEVVELQSFFTKCIKRHRLEAKKKGIRLKLATAELPDEVTMDVGKCNQVLDNLINNAVKYSANGVISVDVNYDFDDETCEVRVEDQGQGIPEIMFFKIFEEFVQGDKTMQGAGIGLTLCKRLAGAMGGNVVVEKSVEGVGTTILWTLRLPKVDDTRNPNIASPPSTTISIMIVDDMNINRNILAKRLEFVRSVGLDYTIVEAVDGQDALNKFKEAEGNFQLILMDCLMPVVDGFEATKLIHNECVMRNLEPVPVVAVTASVSPDIRQKCQRSGMKYVVTKPYTKEELLYSIKACMPTL